MSQPQYIEKQGQYPQSDGQYPQKTGQYTQGPGYPPPGPQYPSQNLQYAPPGPPPVTTQPGAYPGPAMYQTMPTQPRPFQTGLCECWGHPKVCLCASFCSPCLFGRTHAVFRRQGSELPESEWFNGACCGYYCLSYLTGIGGLIWQALRRTEIREKYNLEGSVCKDWAVSCCCCPCGLAQDDIEVRRRERERLTMTENFRNSNNV